MRGACVEEQDPLGACAFCIVLYARRFPSEITTRKNTNQENSPPIVAKTTAAIQNHGKPKLLLLDYLSDGSEICIPVDCLAESPGVPDFYTHVRGIAT